LRSYRIDVLLAGRLQSSATALTSITAKVDLHAEYDAPRLSTFASGLNMIT
jgi:hypothetical protein